MADVSVAPARVAEAKGLGGVEVMVALAERGGDRGGGGKSGDERGSGERVTHTRVTSFPAGVCVCASGTGCGAGERLDS